LTQEVLDFSLCLWLQGYAKSRTSFNYPHFSVSFSITKPLLKFFHQGQFYLINTSTFDNNQHSNYIPHWFR